jgi:hypothetical protein
MNSNDPLFGKRILHILSPVRFTSDGTYEHDRDSNHKVAQKTIDWLPNCHHTVLVPEKHRYYPKTDNVTVLPIEYSKNVLVNRFNFDKAGFNKLIDFRKSEFEYVFIHQPELAYNVMNLFDFKRTGRNVKVFLFFHWVDCKKSRATDNSYHHNYFRQLEGFSIAKKVFFHCEQSTNYFLTNFTDECMITKINEKALKDKIAYMPLSTDLVYDKGEDEAFDLPKDKHIILFNHRWISSTGKDRLIEYTKDLDRSKYLVWITDDTASNPPSGDPAPDWMKVKSLSFKNYKYMLKNARYLTCFVDDYATWNLSVQDGLFYKRPVACYKQDAMPYVLGENYPFYFTKKDDFEKLLTTIPEKFEWALPDHDKTFKKNFIDSMTEFACNNPTKKEPSSARLWLKHILEGNCYKNNIIFSLAGGKIRESHAWTHNYRWLTQNIKGITTDPNEKYVKFIVDETERANLEEMVKDITLKQIIQDKNFRTEKHKSTTKLF